jgi:hypothetical protein
MDSKMLTLAMIPVVVWIGVLIFLFIVDRKVARIESGRKQDDL